MSVNTLKCPPFIGRDVNKRSNYRTSLNPSMAKHVSSKPLQANENGDLAEPKKILGLEKCHVTNSPLVGIIGGVSVFSTLIFLEKLVLRSGGESVPFIVCSDPAISRENGKIVENLRRKRESLEQSGARCIVMPCHISHAWHSEVSEGCSVPFLNVGDCVAREIKQAKLKPLEAGSSVRIGFLAADACFMAALYQEKLQRQGFEVVLPDKPTMEHTVIPAVEALKKKDMKGARTLLRIAIYVLLVRAVNTIILASDELQCLLPHDDPLLQKCIDPMDALARSTIQWAQSTEEVH